MQPSLVLPIKYKSLAQLMGQMDQSIGFLRNRHGQAATVLFEDVCASVKGTFGRDLNAIILGRILKVVPDFYNHHWVNGKLAIEATCDLL